MASAERLKRARAELKKHPPIEELRFNQVTFRQMAAEIILLKATVRELERARLIGSGSGGNE